MKSMHHDIDRDSPIPLHYQIYLQLKQWFTHDFQPGDPLPSELEIAERFTVGRGTARMALNNLVKEGIINRTQGKGSFLNENFFIPLTKYKVGVLLSKAEFENKDVWEYTWVHHLEMINGIFEGASLYNVTCQLIPEEVASSQHDLEVDGYIFFRYIEEEILKQLSNPSVHLRYEIDLISGFRKIAEHVVQIGYNNVAYIGAGNKDLLSIINTVFAEHDRPVFARDNVAECSGGEQASYEACRLLFSAKRRIDCIICSTDVRAIGVLTYLREQGIRIPEEVSVYGFDGIKKAECTDPPLTTYRYDWKYPGLFAVMSLRSSLDKRTPPIFDPPRGELILRGSTRATALR
ncbi:MAG TPA: GntR family transcriptional regulator [bacterium]|nr:GntR family transcriptional regulator [bacterium]